MQFADEVIGIDFFLAEVTKNVLLRKLAAHENRDSIEVIAFFVLELVGAGDSPDPSPQR